MDDIAKHAKSLKQAYCESKDKEELVRSAIELAKLVTNNNNINVRHKRKILSDVQWLITESSGKYKTRYRSKQSVDLANNTPGSCEKINHEHVFPRRTITNLILKNPDHIENILKLVEGCVVTKSEHSKLPGGATGWGRYLQGNVEVYDMTTLPPKIADLGALVRTSNKVLATHLGHEFTKP